MIMLSHFAVNFLNNNDNPKNNNKCASDQSAPCQWWHACLGLPTPVVGEWIPQTKLAYRV